MMEAAMSRLLDTVAPSPGNANSNREEGGDLEADGFTMVKGKKKKEEKSIQNGQIDISEVEQRGDEPQPEQKQDDIDSVMTDNTDNKSPPGRTMRDTLVQVKILNAQSKEVAIAKATGLIAELQIRFEEITIYGSDEKLTQSCTDSGEWRCIAE